MVSRCANHQMGLGFLPELQLISRIQSSIPLKKMATSQSKLYDIDKSTQCSSLLKMIKLKLS